MVQRDNNGYGNNNFRSAEEIERYGRSLFSFFHLERDKKRMRRIKRNIVLCRLKDFGYTEEKFCEKGDGTDRTNGHKMYMKCSEKQRPGRNGCFKSGKCTKQEITDNHAEMAGMCEEKEKFRRK